MAGGGTDATVWTQRYCSSHIGFCVPVHKFWYYTSFGATEDTLWHVEMSTKPIENIGDGPVRVDFVSGVMLDGVVDGTVKETDGRVVGYRSWTTKRHFEISAPSDLRAAVEYMTNALSTYEPEAE